MPHKYFHVDAVATFVHHRGPTTLPGRPPEPASGLAIVCLHGAGDNGAVFDPLLDELSEEGPIAFDFPGHGRSGSLDSLASIPKMAEFTGGLLGALGLEKPVLLGHSMGGMAALQYALDHPDGVAALVLVATSANALVPDEQIEKLERVTQGKARRDLTPRGFSPQTKPDVVRRAIMEKIKTDPRVLLGDVRAVRDFDVDARLGEIRVPALIVLGADADDVGKQESRRLGEIPGSKLVELAGAGHVVPLEVPRALAQAVRTFLAELAP